MARPINPQALRRTSQGSMVEVQGISGQWLPFHIMGPASVENTCRVFGEPPTWPSDAFTWTKADMQERRPQQDDVRPDIPMDPVPQVQQDGPQDEQDQQDQQDQQAPQDQAPQDSQDDTNPLAALERWVEGIAGRLDDAQTSDIMGRVAALTADLQLLKRDDNDPRYVPVTTRIEVRTPVQVIFRDGLFHRQFGTLAKLVSMGQHVFLPGPPGSGKSHAAKQVADTIGWQYAELSVSADMPESRMWGGRAPDGWTETPLIAGLRYAMAHPDQGFVFLIDEMDAGRPSLFLGSNTAMANQRITLPCGDEISWGDNVVFIGAANTFGTGPTAEFSGRNKLDAATLDRFAYIPWDTDPIMEAQVVRSFLYDDNERLADAWLDAWTTLRANVANYGLKTFVTMRGARNGARMLAAGMNLDETMMLVIGNKLPADQWAKVNPL